MDAAIRYVACEPIHIQKVRRNPEDPDEFRNTTGERGHQSPDISARKIPLTPGPSPLVGARGVLGVCVLVLAEGLQAFGFDFGRALVIWTFLQVQIHGFDEQLTVGLHFFSDL